MKDNKKLIRTFTALIFIGVALLVEGIVMKQVYHGDMSMFSYTLYVGPVLMAIGIIGLVITKVKSKKAEEQKGESQPQEAQSVSEVKTAEAAAEQTATETASRVSGEVALVDGDRWRIKTFAILTAVYAVVLIVGIIGYITGFGLQGDNATVCKGVCLAYAFVTPSYFLYLAYGNPFRLPKAATVVIAVVGIAAMVLCFIISFVTISKLPEVEDGFWGFVMNIFIYLAIACAVIGYGLLYGLICKGASSVWYLGVGVGFTVLFPVVAAIIAAIFVISFLIGAIKWLLSCLGIMTADTSFGKGFISGWTGKIMHKNQYSYTDENGYTHTVYSDNGTDFYNSDGSYAGRSDDGGRHIS